MTIPHCPAEPQPPGSWCVSLGVSRDPLIQGPARTPPLLAGGLPLRLRIRVASFSPEGSRPSALSFFQLNSSRSWSFRSECSSDSCDGDSCSCGHTLLCRRLDCHPHPQAGVGGDWGEGQGHCTDTELGQLGTGSKADAGGSDRGPFLNQTLKSQNHLKDFLAGHSSPVEFPEPPSPKH